MYRNAATGQSVNLTRQVELTLGSHARNVDRYCISADPPRRILNLHVDGQIERFGEYIPVERVVGIRIGGDRNGDDGTCHPLTLAPGMGDGLHGCVPLRPALTYEVLEQGKRQQQHEGNARQDGDFH